MVTNAGLLGATGLSLLGGAASTGMGMMAANASQLRQYEYNKLLQQQQAKLNYKYNKKYTQWATNWVNTNQPYAYRLGLENAGLNPMLAVSNGASGVNASSMSGAAGSSSVQAPDYQGAISSGINTAADALRIRNEIQQTESNVSLNDAQTEKATAEAENIRLNNKWVDEKTKAEIGMLGANTAQLESQTAYNKALIDNIDVENALKNKAIEYGLLGTKYASDNNLAGSVYNAHTNYEIAKKERQFQAWLAKNYRASGKSESFKNYATGVGTAIGSAAAIAYPSVGLVRSLLSGPSFSSYTPQPRYSDYSKYSKY